MVVMGINQALITALVLVDGAKIFTKPNEWTEHGQIVFGGLSRQSEQMTIVWSSCSQSPDTATSHILTNHQE